MGGPTAWGGGHGTWRGGTTAWGRARHRFLNMIGGAPLQCHSTGVGPPWHIVLNPPGGVFPHRVCSCIGCVPAQGVFPHGWGCSKSERKPMARPAGPLESFARFQLPALIDSSMLAGWLAGWLVGWLAGWWQWLAANCWKENWNYYVASTHWMLGEVGGWYFSQRRKSPYGSAEERQEDQRTYSGHRLDAHIWRPKVGRSA